MDKVRVANVIVQDKFIDGVMEAQTLFPSMQHDYIYVSDAQPSKYKYIKNVEQIIFVHSSEFISYVVDRKYNAIFLHNFTSLHPALICKIPQTIKVFWFAWGADIYERPVGRCFVPVSLYKRKTRDFIRKQTLKKSKPTTLRHRINELVCSVLKLFQSKNVDINYMALKRIDFFSGVFQYEYELMKRIPQFRARQVEYHYVGGKNSFSNPNLKTYPSPKPYGNILLGNSCSLTNNHLDVLDILSKIKIENKKIIMPLSYGGNNEYLEEIKKTANILFPDDVVCLTDFLPINKYLEIINTCNVAIFYTERQQAVGNIIAAIGCGMKVFLSETSEMFNYFKRKGFVVFSVQSDLTEDGINTPLTETQIKKNLIVIRENYTKDKYLKCLAHIYSCICN